MTAWRQLDLLKHPRRQRGTRAPPAIERRTHIAIAKSLAWGIAPGWISNHIPSGELRTEATGALLKAMGHKPGWSDFVLMDVNGRHHYLELKRGNAPLSEAQEAFRDECLARPGVSWALARSYDEALAILHGWGAIRTTFRVSA